MNEIDLLILRELIKDARTPFLRIAKKLDVSPETVRQKYIKMKKNGIIKRCSISINLSKIGYQGKAFLLITNAPQHDKSKTLAALKKMRNIFIASEIIGHCEIIAVVAVENLSSFENLVNTIKKEPSVNQVEIVLITNTEFPVSSCFGKLFL